MENTLVDHIKAIGGRYVIITFPTPEDRDEIMKKEWLSIWFEKISPWLGEIAKENDLRGYLAMECHLNGWSTQISSSLEIYGVILSRLMIPLFMVNLSLGVES